MKKRRWFVLLPSLYSEQSEKEVEKWCQGSEQGRGDGTREAQVYTVGLRERTFSSGIDEKETKNRKETVMLLVGLIRTTMMFHCPFS